MLTSKQHELLNFIDARQKATGVTPSFDEMKEALNLASKSGIHRLVTALEERGFLRRLPNRARALEVIRRPEREGVLRGRVAEAVASAVEGGIARARLAAEEVSRLVAIPVVGRIAAGVPIEAIETPGRVLAFSADELPAGDHYALEVRGDSMVDAGIFDGDTVVIHRQDSARNGDIVVALVDKSEATLKRYRRQGRRIALEAANPAYETRVLDEGQVDVQGRLVSLLRRY